MWVFIDGGVSVFGGGFVCGNVCGGCVFIGGVSVVSYIKNIFGIEFMWWVILLCGICYFFMYSIWFYVFDYFFCGMGVFIWIYFVVCRKVVKIIWVIFVIIMMES